MATYLAIGSAAKMLGVSVKTLRKWDNTGKFHPRFRTPGGHRCYKRTDIINFAHNNKYSISSEFDSERAGIYARVSGSKQKTSGDLQRQIETLLAYWIEKDYTVEKVYSDVGSGMNDARSGLLRMLDDASKGKFDCLVVNYNDRLSRFGIRIIEKYLDSWDIAVDVINPVIINKNSPHARLVTDLTAMLYSFMGKLYRARKKKGMTLEPQVTKTE